MDRYSFHRLALAPFVATNPVRALQEIRDKVQKTDEQLFLRFLLENGLAALWYETLKKCGETTLFSPAGMDKLHRITLVAAATYLRQQHTLLGISDIFATAGIPHAVFKGVHIRELIYDNPAVRPACDIDILVAKKDKIRAIKALVEAGFSFYPDPVNISHEGQLTNGGTSIDLHWDILRPGRTRIDLTDALLAERERFQNHWGLSNEAALFIMLVHPVFTKYATAPQALLIRLVDLVHWINSREIDWKKTAEYLEEAGVKTAAWITATWLAILTDIALPESFTQLIKPGKIRAWYLQRWIAQDLSTRLLKYPTLIQTGLTLPAHDTFTDAWCAIQLALHEKRQAEHNTKKLLNEIAEHREP